MARTIIIFLFFLLIGCSNSKEICFDNSSCEQAMQNLETAGESIKKETLVLLKKQCRDGGDSSCKVIGDFYKIKKQDFLATKYYAKSCKNKNDISCFENGLALERLKRPQKALDSYYYGCLLSNGGLSCEALGDFLSHNKDWAGAAIFYKKSCDKKNINACSKMARTTLHYLPNFDKKEKYYKEYFQKACDGDDFYSCYFLAELFFEEGKKNKAKIFYYKACFGDIQESCDFYLENYGSRWKEREKRLKLWWDYFLKRFGLR